MGNPDGAHSDSGTHEEVSKQTSIKVTSGTSGYLCHITSETLLPAPPRTVFAIITNPDNCRVFRDIKSCGYRQVLEEATGWRVVEVEQQGEVRLMWKRALFSTRLLVTEDSRDPAALRSSFQLLHSDVLSNFQGSWTLHPGPPGEGGRETTRAVLEQDVLPKGVPAAIQHVPVLGGILRGVCVRAVRRMVDDLQAAVRSMEAGQALPDVLSGGKGRLGSHALDDLESDSGSDSSSEA